MSFDQRYGLKVLGQDRTIDIESGEFHLVTDVAGATPVTFQYRLTRTHSWIQILDHQGSGLSHSTPRLSLVRLPRGQVRAQGGDGTSKVYLVPFRHMEPHSAGNPK